MGTAADADATDRFAFEGADTGWVTPRWGVDGFQLRVGVPPGGAPDPLVTMAPPHAGRAVDVSLHEAIPHDPAAPAGKAFARVEDGWAGGGAAPEPLAGEAAAAAAAAAAASTTPAAPLPGTPPVRVMSRASLRSGGVGSGHGSGASLGGGGGGGTDAWPPSASVLPGAAVSAADAPTPGAAATTPARTSGAAEGVTFLMNGPSLAALAFRVDVRDTSGALLGRGFVPAAALAPLEGSLVVPLLSPGPDGLGLAGEFRAAFLVVTALDHPANTLAGLQRARWTAGEGRLPTLDIGHRGVGASAGARARVAENTVLAFAAAAAHHTEYVEFDVHVTADGEVVVHHDFDVRLALGGKANGGGGGGEGGIGGDGERPKPRAPTAAGGSGLSSSARAPPDGLVALPIAGLTLAQLTSPAIAAAMRAAAPQGAAAAALSSHEAELAKTLKRTLSSGEDIVRSHRPPPLAGSPSAAASASTAAAAVLASGLASSRPGSGPPPASPLDAVPEDGGPLPTTLPRPSPAARSAFAADAAAAVAAADAATAAASHHPPSTSAADAAWRIADARVATLRECFRSVPPWVGFNIELKFPADPADPAGRAAAARGRNAFCDAVLRVVLDEGVRTDGGGQGGGAATHPPRRIIFSTFDPDCATLLSLKQPRFPVFFLTCAGGEAFADPRMNTLAAALEFAAASRLQGVVAEAGGVIAAGLAPTVAAFHSRGLHLFTWGAPNNDPATYAAQRAAGVDAIISDDVAQHARASGKRASAFVGTGGGGAGGGRRDDAGTATAIATATATASTALAGGSPVAGPPLLLSTPPANGPLSTAADLLAALEAEGAFEERPRGASPKGLHPPGSTLRGASPPRDIPKRAVGEAWE